MVDELISVIIPVYNVEQYLKRCLESVINQTYKNIEIICINDGSTDKSLNILENYKTQDNRIKVFNQENKGLSETRNRGINLAEGKYIFFIDSDDWLELNALESLMSKIILEEIDIVIGGINKVYFNKKIKVVLNCNSKNIYNPSEYIESAINEKKFVVNVWNKLYKKEILLKNKIKFKEGRLYEDFLFTLQYLLKCRKIYITENIVYNYFLFRENSIVNKISEKDLDIFKNIKNIELEVSGTDLLNKKYFKEYIYEWIMSATISKLFKFGKKQEIKRYQLILKKNEIFEKYYKYYLQDKKIKYKKIISYIFINNLNFFIGLSNIYKIYKNRFH